MTEGEYQALRTYGYGNFRTEIYEFPKVACPICGKECGGKSGTLGEQGKYEGVHQHIRFKHGIKQKWKREELLGIPK